jgi:hypothetical protein
MTPAEREALPPVDITEEEDGWAVNNSVSAASAYLMAKLKCRERQLLAKMDLISSLEITLSNATGVMEVQAKRIAALEASEKWTPIQQGKPVGEDHLLCLENGCMCVGYWNRLVKGWMVAGIIIDGLYVTHWMPLPGPTETTPPSSIHGVRSSIPSSADKTFHVHAPDTEKL